MEEALNLSSDRLLDDDDMLGIERTYTHDKIRHNALTTYAPKTYRFNITSTSQPIAKQYYIIPTQKLQIKHNCIQRTQISILLCTKGVPFTPKKRNPTI